MLGMNRPCVVNPVMLWVLILLLWAPSALVFAQNGVLQGWVWQDENGNGIREEHESPLANWPIQLQSGQQQRSGPDGSYSFSQLAPGAYTVRQGNPSGWQPSFPVTEISFTEDLHWNRPLTAGKNGYAVNVALATDANGATYAGGTFSGTVDLDPGAGLDPHTDNGIGLYVVKLDAQGQLAWSRTASAGHTGGFAGVVEDVNGVYVAGYFQRPTFGFASAPAEDALTNPGFYSLFVSHFRPDGTHGWTRIIGGPGSMTLGHDLVVDRAGGLYVTGSFNQSVDFDPGPGSRTVLARGNELFLLKLNADAGTLAWVRTSRGLTQARGVSLAVDHRQGNVLLTGAYRTYIDLNWGDGQAHLQSHGDWDTFSASVTAAGTLQWARSISGSYSILPYDSAVDSTGSHYVTGMYTGHVEFDPGLGQDLRHYTYEAMGQAFLWKLDAEGQYQWTRTQGTELDATAGTGVTVDSMDRVFWVGERTDAYPDPNFVAQADLFLTACDAQGQHLSTSTLPGLIPADISDNWLYSFTPRRWRVAAYPGGALAVTGQLQACADLDPGVGEVIHCAVSGATDSFLLRFEGDPRTAGWTVELEPGQVIQGLDFASYPQVAPH